MLVEHGAEVCAHGSQRVFIAAFDYLGAQGPNPTFKPINLVVRHTDLALLMRIRKTRRHVQFKCNQYTCRFLGREHDYNCELRKEKEEAPGRTTPVDLRGLACRAVLWQHHRFRTEDYEIHLLAGHRGSGGAD